LIQDFEANIMGHFVSGNLVPIIDRVFRFENIQQAHALIESNSNIGKVLIKVYDESDGKNTGDNSNKTEL
jgi:tumor protein p53-inducible protein 3